MNKVDGRIQVAVEGGGGQGIILFGLLFAKAASFDGFRVSFVPVYGSTITGGRSRSDVIISKEQEIMHPLVEGKPDVLVVFDRDAYKGNAKVGGLKIFAGEAVTVNMGGIFRIKNVSLASGLGSKVVANIVMLGFVAGKTRVVSAESFREAIRQTLPREFVELNLKAFEAGLKESAGK